MNLGVIKIEIEEGETPDVVMERVERKLKAQVNEDELPDGLVNAIRQKIEQAFAERANRMPNRPFDFHQKAEQIRNLPREERRAALRKAFEELADANNIPQEIREELFNHGIEHTEREFGINYDDAMDNTKTDEDLAKDFETAFNKYKDMFGEKAIHRVKDFRDLQEPVVTGMAALLSEAMNYNDKEAAELYLQIEAYLTHRNLTLYDQFDKAEADITALGFKSREQYLKTAHDTKYIKLRRDIREKYNLPS